MPQLFRQLRIPDRYTISGTALTAEQQQKTLELLKLPANTGPAEWWLTEFEDFWPYQTAPGDVYFSRNSDQSTVKRPPMVEYVSSVFPTDPTVYAVAGLFVLPVAYRLRRGRKPSAAAASEGTDLA